MKRDLDDILKRALTPNEEPDFRLNRKLLNRAKEREHMAERNKMTAKIPALVLSAALVIGIGSGSVYAAWKYLTPDAVAEEFNDEKLGAVFKDGEEINEVQTYGGYRIALLGIASGDSISEFLPTVNGEVDSDRFYSVVAIEREDGTPMPETSSEEYGKQPFFISPLMQGCDPAWYNAVTMGGGYSATVKDGIEYRLAECTNVEVFADKEIYLCVCDGTFYKSEAYLYDGATGKISRNESYTGANALFRLPIDAAKADQEAAAALLEKVDAGMNGGEETTDTEPGEISEAEQFYRQLTPENIDTCAKPVESTRQTLTPDADGWVTVRDDEGDETGFNVDWALDSSQTGKRQIVGAGYSDTLDSLEIETAVINADGTVEYVVYVPR